jgi:hypothetical protein
MELMETPVNDSVRDEYLSRITPEQHAELLKLEINNLEDMQKHYQENPLKQNALKHKAFMLILANKINDKYSLIKKLEKEINIKK